MHWGPPVETMRGPLLEGQSAAKSHAWCKMPHIEQSATLQDMYFIKRECESLKATKKDFDEFVLQYFQKIMAYHLFGLCISMYVLSYKKY